MPVLNILEFPDPRLRKVAKPVAQVTPAITQLTDDMLDTMYAADGIGLAATQIDVHKRIVVVDVSDGGDKPLVLINPHWTAVGEAMTTYKEGCLSVPEFYDDVNRYLRITYRGLDRKGVPIEGQAEGLLSICIQHELDHLNGKLFVDYLSSLKRERVRKKLEKKHRLQQQ